MFEQAFKNINDILYKDTGADSKPDYSGQTSWVMMQPLNEETGNILLTIKELL